jgi:hypothetical protein
MGYVLERLCMVHASGIGNTKEAGCTTYRWQEIALCDEPGPLEDMLAKSNPMFQYGGRVKERYSDKIVVTL